MKLVTLYLPEPYIRALDSLVNEKRIYPNRAEAFRITVRRTTVYPQMRAHRAMEGGIKVGK